MRIRQAQLVDARYIGSCHYYCWQETYRGLISDTYLDQMQEEKNQARFEEILTRVGHDQYVVEEGNEVIGFFDISSPRETYAPFEVGGFYLRQAYHG